MNKRLQNPQPGSTGPRHQLKTSENTGYSQSQAANPQGTGRVRGIFSRHHRASKPHKPSAITVAVTNWCERLLGVATARSFHEGEEEYEANCTSQDFLWNTAGMAAWGAVFPLLTIIVTQLSGAETAGMFSMAFVVASLLMILANFGIRTFQISDVREEYSFADYRVNRVITTVLAILVGYIYCQIRGYDEAMSSLCMGVIVYKAIDGMADVYEGRLQQMGKMYLAGSSLTIRSAVVFVVFSLALLVSGNVAFAANAMAVVAVISLVVFTLPLAHMETPESRPFMFSHVIGLFKHSWPLFAALFMYSLIDNMPKFVMENALAYENQLYYNALYFPAMFVLMTAQSVYKPMLVKMANVWYDPAKRRRFDLIIVAVVAGIILITFVMSLFMYGVGVDILGFLYGLDFSAFHQISVIMIISGGITAGIDFLYQTITILRRQKDVMMAYVISLIMSLFTPMLLVEYAKLEGAVLSYLIVMSVLFILMLWIYVRIRFRPDAPNPPQNDFAPRQVGGAAGSAGVAGAAAQDRALQRRAPREHALTSDRVPPTSARASQNRASRQKGERHESSYQSRRR